MMASATTPIGDPELAQGPGKPVIVAFEAGERATLRNRLATITAARRRLAIVLTPTTTAEQLRDLLARLGQAGCPVGHLPSDSAALLQWVQSAPPGAEELARSDYELFFATLPDRFQAAVLERWGALEEDPLFRPGELDCGRFLLPGWQRGPVAVGRAPVVGYRLATVSRLGAPQPVPPHAYLAFCCWLRDGLRVPLAIELPDSSST